MTLQTQQVDMPVTAVTNGVTGVAEAYIPCPSGTKPVSGAWSMDIGANEWPDVAVYVNELSFDPDYPNSWHLAVVGLSVGNQVYLSAICASAS